MRLVLRGHDKLTSCDDEFEGQPIEAVLAEINAIYDMNPKIKGRVERAAADLRVKMLWKVVERKRREGDA